MKIEIVDYDNDNYSVSIAFNAEPTYVDLTLSLSDLHVLKEVLDNAIIELNQRVKNQVGNTEAKRE
jgi:hypothetical protein